jgi:hypothetical protein
MRPFVAILLLLVLLLPAPAAAANSLREGEFVLHWSAVPTTMLTPAVAKQAGITRSANRVLVNIAVRRGPDGTDTAVPATVKIAATNLAGQRELLDVREHREGDAIYYLAQARVAGEDTVTFEVEALPQGGRPLRTTFRQDFFPQ